MFLQVVVSYIRWVYFAQKIIANKKASIKLAFHCIFKVYAFALTEAIFALIFSVVNESGLSIG